MTKSITSCELAKICGVSQGTVDRALNNRPGISKDTKKKILEAAEKYGYFPNIHASKLAGGKSTLIGVVVFDLKNEYFSELVCSIDNCCRKLGCTSITMFSNKDKDEELACIQKLISIGVDGLIICPINKAEALEPIKALNIPVVTVGNRAEGIPYCGISDFEAMEQLTIRACQKGHSLIYYSPALSSSPDDNFSAQQLRCDGFCKAATDTGSAYQICTNLDDIESALGQVGESANPCIICSSDYYALKIFAIYPHLPTYSFDSTRILSLISKQTVAAGVDADKVAENALHTILEEKNDDVVIQFEITEVNGSF